MAREKKHPLRHRAYLWLEPAGAGISVSDWSHSALLIMIMISVAVGVLETVPSINSHYSGIFLSIEFLSVAMFTIEYALRIWSAPEHGPFYNLHPHTARLKFIFSGYALIDLLAILPFYLNLLHFDFPGLISLRLLRFFKLARYSPTMVGLANALYSERRALIGSLIILIGMVIILASGMYAIERTIQPEKLGSIPLAMWWAVVTITTVGYGDVVPVTILGKVLGGITAIVGLVMSALPVVIVATAFEREIRQRDFLINWNMVAHVPLFADLDAGALSEIISILRSQTYEPGEMIVRRGEKAHSMYFISSGIVEIELPNQRVTMGSGQYFGEIAILENTVRSATIKAKETTRVLILEAEDFQRLVESNPEMEKSIRRQTYERLKQQGDLS